MSSEADQLYEAWLVEAFKVWVLTNMPEADREWWSKAAIYYVDRESHWDCCCYSDYTRDDWVSGKVEFRGVIYGSPKQERTWSWEPGRYGLPDIIQSMMELEVTEPLEDICPHESYEDD